MNVTDIRTDPRGVEYADHGDLDPLPKGWATCGVCGRVWNDAKSTSVTPTPSARCPFEDKHVAPIPKDLAITLHGGARNVLQNVRRMLDQAHMWVQDPDNWRDLYDLHDDDPLVQLRNEQAQFYKLLDKVAEMRRSFYERFADVITMGGNEVHFYWDSDRSLTWQSGGMFGGLIFHADYANKGTQRLPIGSWSLHT